MTIKFYEPDRFADSMLKYAVICASFKGKWIYVRHRDRNTLEVPGGHREKDEEIGAAAARELFEETGAISYEMEPVAVYSITDTVPDACQQTAEVSVVESTTEGTTVTSEADGTTKSAETEGTIESWTAEGMPGEFAADGIPIDRATSFGGLFYANVTELGPLPESEIAQVMLRRDIPIDLTYPDIQPVLLEKVRRHLREKFLTILRRDPIRNINFIRFMTSYDCHSFDKAGDSLLVRGRSDEDWVYISSKSAEEFNRLIEGLEQEDKCFAVLEDWMLPAIVGSREVRSRLTSLKLVYDVEKGMIPSVTAPLISALNAGDAPEIYEISEYREYISIGYIEERIRNGVSAGIRENGRLVAWALTHDDGAIGFLHVSTKYRGRGYALRVTEAVIHKLLTAGELPFVHIEESNTASLNLAKKLGFITDRRVHWFKLN